MVKNFLIHLLQKYVSPFMYFKQLYDDDLIKHIADQTNLYSVQCTGKSRNVDENEIEQYFGMLIFMSVVELEQEKHMSEEVERLMIVQVYADTFVENTSKNKKVLLPYFLLSTWNICHQWMVTLSQRSEPKEYS